MAETGFNPRPAPVVASYAESRDIHADRPRDGVRRVEPAEQADLSARLNEETGADSEDIARIAQTALSNSRLKILQDDTSGEYIYLMVDQDTGETIRRWPPEEHGDLLEYLKYKQAGLLNRTA